MEAERPTGSGCVWAQPLGAEGEEGLGFEISSEQKSLRPSECEGLGNRNDVG